MARIMLSNPEKVFALFCFEIHLNLNMFNITERRMHFGSFNGT